MERPDDNTPQARKTTTLRLRGPIAAALVLMLLASAVPVTADHEPWHISSEPGDLVAEPADQILVPFLRKCERVDEDDELDPWYTAVGEIFAVSPLLPRIGKVPCWDYGDAPDSDEATQTLYPTGYPSGSPYGWFPTTSDTQNTVFGGQPGARHQYVDVAWLGDISSGKDLSDCDDTPSREFDADRLPGDDHPVRNLDSYSVTPDQDTHDNGLHDAFLPAGGIGEITVRVSACEAIERWYLNVLIDWDFDGRWDGFDPIGRAPEWVVENGPVSLGANSAQDFSYRIPVGIIAGKPWTRVTLTERPIERNSDLGWDGSVPPGHFDDQDRPGFLYGETEDHCGPIQLFDRDGQQPNGGPCIGEDEPPEGCADPTRDSYVIDISTGTTDGTQQPLQEVDPFWRVTKPGQNTSEDAWTVTPHPSWHTPTSGQWIAPDGDQNYPGWGNNNPGAQAFSVFRYEAEVVVDDPHAVAVTYDFSWWRDEVSDPTVEAGTGFYYFSDSTNQWELLSSGSGFATPTETVVQQTLGIQSTYPLRVDVWNWILWVGLLVEGQVTVHCTAQGLP